MKKLINFLKNPLLAIPVLGSKGLLTFLPDTIYLKLLYRSRLNKKLNLKNPKTYNEKIQWLKINDRKPYYSKLVDKYEVRKYVSDKIGEEFLVPLYGVWDEFDAIDFDRLPRRFVLKTTHDSGGVVICRDKNKLDKVKAKQLLEKSLARKYSLANRERVYDDVKPRIIAEKFLEKNNGDGLDDYKFFCFDGEVKALFIATERKTQPKFDFFSKDFTPLPLKQYYPNSNKKHKMPKKYKEMIMLSEKLSENIPHVRVDLYNNNGSIYFGEITFYHFSGTKKFEPEIYDEIFGNWINLPSS